MKAQCKRWLDRKIEKIQSNESYSPEHTNESIAKKYGFHLVSKLESSVTSRGVTVAETVEKDHELSIHKLSEIGQEVTKLAYSLTDSKALSGTAVAPQPSLGYVLATLKAECNDLPEEEWKQRMVLSSCCAVCEDSRATPGMQCPCCHAPLCLGLAHSSAKR
jgi:hypothetical protein